MHKYAHTCICVVYIRNHYSYFQNTHACLRCTVYSYPVEIWCISHAYMIVIRTVHNVYVVMYLCMYILYTTYMCGLPLGPLTPQFDYCISYNDGQPALQVISHVCMYVPTYKFNFLFLGIKRVLRILWGMDNTMYIVNA